MKFVKSEEIVVSNAEFTTLTNAYDLLRNIANNASDPQHIAEAEESLNTLRRIITMVAVDIND